MTEITLNLTLKELQQIDKYVEVNDDTLSVLMKIKDAYPDRSPIEEAYKEWMGEYPSTDESVDNTNDIRWRAFQIGWMKAQNNCEDISRVLIEGDDAYIMGVKYQRVEEPYCPDDPEWYDEVEWDEKDNPKPMNEVMDRLENKYKQAEENAASYITDEVVDRMLKEWEENPPEFLKFELGKTLEALITRWWCDVFGGINQDWDMETAIDDLVDRIQLWLPREQSHEGTQSVSVIDLVDGYNDALTKIKSKLRNKK
jgi:hypothetical protein